MTRQLKEVSGAGIESVTTETTYGYNTRGYLISENNAVKNTTIHITSSNFYDWRGRVIRNIFHISTVGCSIEQTYTYDPRGQLTVITAPQLQTDFSFSSTGVTSYSGNIMAWRT